MLLPDMPLLSWKNISENQKGTLDFYAHRKYIKDMEVNMDKKKMGRPAKGSNAATERRDFRLTKAQDERLKRYCAMTGTSIRKCLCSCGNPQIADIILPPCAIVVHPAFTCSIKFVCIAK